MDPITAVIISSAAESFGKELGSELARSLFGTRSGRDIKRISSDLRKIDNELTRINAKLTYLIGLVANLSQVILEEYEKGRADDAYRELDSDRALLDGEAKEGGQLALPTGAECRSLLKHWFTIVDLESRPDRLLLLIAYTQYIRERIIVDVDGELKERLARKKKAVDEAIQNSAAKVARAIELAESNQHDSTWGAGFFVNFEISAEEPMIRYGIYDSPAHPVTRARAWRDQAARAAGDMEEQRKIMEREARAIKALVPVQKLIELYLPFLQGDGRADSPDIALREGPPGIQLVSA